MPWHTSDTVGSTIVPAQLQNPTEAKENAASLAGERGAGSFEKAVKLLWDDTAKEALEASRQMLICDCEKAERFLFDGNRETWMASYARLVLLDVANLLRELAP